MNVLEKILEEIENMRDIMESTVSIDCFGKDCEHDDCTVCVCERTMEIVRSHMDEMNDDWIPCSKRLPTKDMDNHPVWITYGSCGNLSTEIAYCEWVLSQDENGDDDSYNRFRIEQSPEAYYPSANLVHAWKPVKIPEPYRAADKPDWKENMLNTFLAGH